MISPGRPLQHGIMRARAKGLDIKIEKSHNIGRSWGRLPSHAILQSCGGVYTGFSILG